MDKRARLLPWSCGFESHGEYQAFIAQWTEQPVSTRQAVGSNPTGGTHIHIMRDESQYVDNGETAIGVAHRLESDWTARSWEFDSPSLRHRSGKCSSRRPDGVGLGWTTEANALPLGSMSDNLRISCLSERNWQRPGFVNRSSGFEPLFRLHPRRVIGGAPVEGRDSLGTRRRTHEGGTPP